MDRIGRKRLAIDIPIGMHKLLETIAIKRNITITLIVKRAITEFIIKEKKYD